MSLKHTNDWREQVLSAYLEDNRDGLRSISITHRVDLEQCERQWNHWHDVSQLLKNSCNLEPSMMTVNRILAYAKEVPQTLTPWQKIWMGFPVRSVSVLAGFATLVIVSLLTLHSGQVPEHTQEGKSAQVFNKEVPFHPIASPLDFRRQFAASNSSRSQYRLNGNSSLVSPVSFGDVDTRLDIDETLDQKMMDHSILAENEINALFFRARRWERLGFFKEALRDYQFLARSYPENVNIPAIQLAMANCLEALKQKDKAISVLERFEDTYGPSEDIEIWIDDLKSEAF